MEQPQFEIRAAYAADAAELCALLNATIRKGGTTAMETPFSVEAFRDHFLRGPDHISCFVAVARSDQSLLGFQALEHYEDLPDNWADIGTFARLEAKVKGVGTALFQATKNLASEHGFAAINATIRADNLSGLSYYTKMGFEDYSVARQVPLKDGTPVDRISKRYLLAPK